ncbi:MAG: FAD binding domain-containing protein [Coriobacteriales bacterium]|jgi:xanthine dehydrogenase YagS FAD-binding subunit|nr:FAD binding domain-containing protein [Coriobacteriales bacterium]
MRPFTHFDASSTSDAASTASAGGALFIAGGTDVLGTLKDEILPTYPRRLVNLKSIEGLDYIKEEGDVVKIGPLVTLEALAEDETVRSRFACLAAAAERVSGPTQRKMGTIGGNICQMHRCWYFRTPENRFPCLRKGGDTCFAFTGDSRYHSIFGAEQGCIAASPHDTAPALIALDATIQTTSASYSAADFFAVNGARSNVLQDGEVVTEIQIPNRETRSAFQKFAERKAIDFPLVNCAAASSSEGVRLVLGGVFPMPLRMPDAEAALAGGISEGSAGAAADAVVALAKPLSKNAYKVEIARALVGRTLLEIA